MVAIVALVVASLWRRQAEVPLTPHLSSLLHTCRL